MNDGWTVETWLAWWSHWAWYQGHCEAESLRLHGKVIGRPWRHWLQDTVKLGLAND